MVYAIMIFEISRNNLLKNNKNSEKLTIDFNQDFDFDMEDFFEPIVEYLSSMIQKQ